MILLHWLLDQVRALGGDRCAESNLLYSVDLLKAILSAPKVVPEILPVFVPYSLVLVGFAAFVIWNGGIVLGQSVWGGWWPIGWPS